MAKWDFSGWATKANLKCSDGRTIMRDAFKDNDGQIVPLVWNHQHDDPAEILGHALLENRKDGVYTYGKFNNTDSGRTAKLLVKNGDINALSIYANQLKQNMSNVVHGNIREVSLVLAGANPGAFIDCESIAHSDGTDDAALIGYVPTGDNDAMELYHSDEYEEEENMGNNERTVQDVLDEMTEEQRDVVAALIGEAIEDTHAEYEEALAEGYDDDEDYDDYEEDDDMKHNVFDADEANPVRYLSHAEEEAIMENAKRLGSFKQAFDAFKEENDTLQHGFSDYTNLFPENEWINTPGAPKIIDNDESWVARVLAKVQKSPITRVRSRYVDLRQADLRGLGYTKGEQKKLMGSFSMIGRSTDPQTIYVKEKMERDDILDITDFDVVDYIKKIMKQKLETEIATAILLGDGRSEAHEDKIKPEHVRPVWGDNPLYTIYQDVDIETARAELQGSNTSAYFGENYIYAEAIISAALHAREKYKGSGSLDFYCTPHLLNVMLLARDLNGRRIYESKNDLAAALDVNAIYTIEQMEGKTRKDADNHTKKLLGLFYNVGDYQVGAAKGGQITNFEDFDIDFNRYKYLMETRMSGANTRVFSAIALEEPVRAPQQGGASGDDGSGDDGSGDDASGDED